MGVDRVNFPPLGTYSSLRGDGAPYIVNGALDLDRIAKLARWDHVVLDLGPAVAHPEMIAALRAANPAIKLHAYVVMQAAQWPGAFFREVYNAVRDTNGFVHLVGSELLWGFTNINLASRGTVIALAEIINHYARGWDGIFIDILIPRLINAAQDGGASMLDWRRMGFATEAAFLAAWEAGATQLVTLLQGKPLTSNYGWGHPLGNGHVIENFPGTNHETWQQAMNGIWTAPHAEPHTNFICVELHRGSDGRYHWDDPINRRLARFALGSACLADGCFGGFGRFEGDKAWCEDRLEFFMPEYSHPRYGKGWLGEPVEKAHQSRTDAYLWMRTFTNGIVIVNTDKMQAHSVYLPRRCRPIQGVAKEGWSIAAQDALIAEWV